MINLIVAVSLNGVIGNKNKLPWNIPEELQTFKEITTGNPIVMGYNTYKSFKSSLPNRTNYVLTNVNNQILSSGFIPIFYDDVIELGKTSNIFVIGGAKTYNKFLCDDLIDVMYVSYILDCYFGDTYFNIVPNLELYSMKIYKKTEQFITIKYERM